MVKELYQTRYIATTSRGLLDVATGRARCPRLMKRSTVYAEAGVAVDIGYGNSLMTRLQPLPVPIDPSTHSGPIFGGFAAEIDQNRPILTRFSPNSRIKRPFRSF